MCLEVFYTNSIFGSLLLPLFPYICKMQAVLKPRAEFICHLFRLVQILGRLIKIIISIVSQGCLTDRITIIYRFWPGFNQFVR